MMGLQDFLNAVRAMRTHQIAYFKDRKQSDLITAKVWEKFVDKGLAEGVTVTLENVPEAQLVEETEPKQSNLFE